MRRDTWIVLWVLATIPAVILAASAACSWAIAEGASMQWRLLFRMICHGRVDRALELFGIAMPICARCTGIYAGMLAGLSAFCGMQILREHVTRAAVIMAATPLALDGLTQLTGLRESTNPLRIATGLVAGFAFGLWILSAVERREEAVVASP